MSTMTPFANALRQKPCRVNSAFTRSLIAQGIIWCLRGVTYAIVVLVAYIILDIAVKGIPVMSWTFISAFPQQGGATGGILPAIIGTVCLVFLAVSVALPLGIASAVYLSEYAKDNRLTRLIRLGIITLAGVPSIIFGLFGLALFVILLGFGASILAGGLTLACMILPTIIVATEEALRAIPKSFREGSLALGAGKWQTIYLNVLPYAFPGIMTGAILSIGRAAGETAPILLTAAAFFLPALPTSVFDQVMALPYHLYILATQHPDAALVRPMQYGTALVLLVLVFGMNLIAIFTRNYFREKYKW
jgi:phosphate transport system permease protein